MLSMGERGHIRSAMRWTIASLYTLVGFVHLMRPDKLLLIVPDWVPMASHVIFATGIFEIGVSLALLMKPLRKWAGLAMACYALCVWPANFKHAFEGIQIPDFPNSWLYHGPRLLLQPVIMWWALYAAKATDWPRARNDRQD
jgi:uncharacterized membrane protein